MISVSFDTHTYAYVSIIRVHRMSLHIVIKSTRDVLLDNGLSLTKYNANDLSRLQDVASIDDGINVDHLVSISDSKVLGILWNSEKNYFYFDIPIPDESVITRRYIFNVGASIFDSLGLISHIIVMGKMIFQQTTRLKLLWDDPVPDEIRGKWLKWINTLHQLRIIQVPRYIKPRDFNDSYFELHYFNAANEHSYGCCLYVRCLNKCGIHTSLVYAKHIFSPIHSATIPRLELQSAVLSAKVTHTINN